MKPPQAYRADVDGLRAVAILPVVLYHAWPETFPGGYMGVDVFFVISGFLISGVIFKACEAGTFSYRDFYVRRIRRIFPALGVVLLACILVGWLALLPDEWTQLGKHVAGGAGFVSNLLLWREAGYFDAAAETKPLLHLWSLGIEEQYYIVWPVLVAALWKRPRGFPILIAALAVGSFALNVYWSAVRPSAAFYLPMTRFWELMAGALLAYAALRRPAWMAGVTSGARGDVVAAAGALLLALAFVLLDRESSFPGWWALAPTAGTFLLILAGPASWLNRRLLSHPWAVFVGLVSYPLYLWHWPGIVFGRLSGLSEAAWAPPALVALTFLLAVATYRWVETPIRSGRLSHARTAVGLGVAMAVIGCAGLALGLRLPALHSAEEITRLTRAAGEWDYPGRLEPFGHSGFVLWQMGAPEAETLLFFGDSTVEQYYPRAEVLLRASPRPVRVVFATMGGCPPIPRIARRGRYACPRFVDEIRGYARRPDVTTVVLGAHWFGYFDGRGGFALDDGGLRPLKAGNAAYRLAMQSFRDLALELVAMKKRVFIVGSIPTGARLDPKGMVTRSVFRPEYVSIDSSGMTRSEILGGNELVAADLKSLAEASGAFLISPMESLCDGERCPSTTDEGEPIYKDHAHLRPTFVRARVRYLDEVFP